MVKENKNSTARAGGVSSEPKCVKTIIKYFYSDVEAREFVRRYGLTKEIWDEKYPDKLFLGNFCDPFDEVEIEVTEWSNGSVDITVIVKYFQEEDDFFVFEGLKPLK